MIEGTKKNEFDDEAMDDVTAGAKDEVDDRRASWVITGREKDESVGRNVGRVTADNWLAESAFGSLTEAAK